MENVYYSKQITLVDDEQNTVDVKISSLNEGLVESFNTNSLILKISKDNELFSKSILNTSDDINNFQDKTIDQLIEQSTIYIDAISFKFNDDVRGFGINIIKDTNPIDIRTSTYLALGATGVRGAQVTYLSENRNSCYLDIDLARRNFGQWFWYEMGDGNLQTPVSAWVSVSSQEYDRYRLRVNSQGWRCANDDNVDWEIMWICPENPNGEC